MKEVNLLKKTYRDQEMSVEVKTPASITNADIMRDCYEKLHDHRILWTPTEIIDDNLNELCKQIIVWNMEDFGKPVQDRKPIYIIVSCYGGEDDCTYALMDTIAASKTPVYTVNYSVAMSNGLSILVAGHKRYAMKHSTAMYHSGSAGLQGTKEQLDAASKFIASRDKSYEDWFNSRCSIDPKLFKKQKTKDWYMNVDDMLNYKIVDEVIENLEDFFSVR